MGCFGAVIGSAEIGGETLLALSESGVVAGEFGTGLALLGGLTGAGVIIGVGYVLYRYC